MFAYILVLLLALLTLTACTDDPPPPSVPKRTITWSTVETTMPTKTTLSTPPFDVGKPCELLTHEEIEALGLEPPGTRETRQEGFACTWHGRDFSVIIITSLARPLSQIEASRPGRRISVGDRAASLAEGRGEYAGLCDIALDITRIASAQILLSHHDDNTQAACVNAGKVALLIHPKLPDG